MAVYFTAKIRQEIGDNLKKARKRKRMKQIDVAQEAGINETYYGRIEGGLVNPSVEKIYKIIKVLGIKSSDIFPF